jgi:hypothetical protein
MKAKFTINIETFHSQGLEQVTTSDVRVSN